MLVGFVYPFFEGMIWNRHYGLQDWLKSSFGADFHDFAGSVVVHAVGGWIALAAVLLLGARRGRYTKDGMVAAHPPSSIPFLALGAWIYAETARTAQKAFDDASARVLEEVQRRYTAPVATLVGAQGLFAASANGSR